MLGILVAIGAAFSWTTACFMWRAQTRFFSPIQLNSLKNLIAVIIFSPILFSINWVDHWQEISILFLSGFIGIAIGDSLYIVALTRLGTRKTLSIEALSPVLANLLATILIGEFLPLRAWLGTFIVTCSLIGITTDGKSINDFEPQIATNYRSGIIYAISSVTCAVFAAILSRIVLTTSDLSPFQTTEIRLCAATLCLLPIARIKHNYIINEISVENKLKILVATLLGTNIGILLQQTVFAILPIGLGWTLLSTSPVISLLFSRAEGEIISYKSIFFAFTTLGGVAIALL